MTPKHCVMLYLFYFILLTLFTINTEMLYFEKTANVLLSACSHDCGSGVNAPQ